MGRDEYQLRSIAFFLLKAGVIFALCIAAWTFAVRYYAVVPASIANGALHLAEIDDITWLGRSANPEYDVAVFHRDAAGERDSLFDFRVESLHTDLPLIVALIAATPFRWKRRLKSLAWGVIITILTESAVCIVVMIWSYTFLPDHHVFSPFQSAPTRNAIIDFLYRWYSGAGIGVLPVLTWIAVCIRKKDIGVIVRGR